ncbi:MAG TPA: uracil-DNA glycosylase family protein [Gemmatimonadaceae bacterium]
MDGREALRRYLEQRKELGETELVLDTLSVEEAMRILGAAMTSSSREAEPSADWRSAIRAAGGAPLARPSLGTPAVSENVANVTSPPEAVVPVAAPEGLVVGASARAPFDDSVAKLDTLEVISRAVATCTKCPLYATATNPVPGTGNPNADFMCVGEAPGASEDAQGVPFVGQAGQLLTKILEAIHLKREDVFIANVLKHRPPGNRNPLPDEVTACSPYLVRQIELVKPKVILALGTFAAQTLLETKLTIGRLRGQVHRYYGVPLVVTYHPAALLRNPSWKRPAWEDVQLARRILDSAVAPGA